MTEWSYGGTIVANQSLDFDLHKVDGRQQNTHQQHTRHPKTPQTKRINQSHPSSLFSPTEQKREKLLDRRVFGANHFGDDDRGWLDAAEDVDRAFDGSGDGDGDKNA